MDGYMRFRYDYKGILRRRKWHLMLPLLAILALSVALAYSLPPVYRSSATILIEQQEIPQDLVRTTVTSYATERIEIIAQRVLTRANLRAIIEKHDLYPEERVQNPDYVVQRLRASISQEMVSANIIDPRSRRPGRTVIAFMLSVEDRDPETAQKVAAELVSLYLEENQRLRSEKAEVTSVFIAEEANRLGQEISELEAKLAEFKQAHVGRLPDHMSVNLRQFDSTERSLEALERETNMLRERELYLESRLAHTEPVAPVYTGSGQRVLSPPERLRSLQAQYLTASASYSPDHPDVTRMRREIEVLSRELGVTNSLAVREELAAARAALAAAEERYSEAHPDVVRLRRQVAGLEEAAKALPARNATPFQQPPDNPTYVALETELQALRLRLAAQERQRAQLQARLAEYEVRIAQTPAVEQEYLTLSRDYDNARSKYSEMREKLLQARMAEELERESRGERFSLIEPPRVPGAPDKPNRLAIIFLGSVVSVGSGAGFAAAAEYLDRSVRSAYALTSVLKAPPLAVIPYIGQRQARRRRVPLRLRVALALFAGALIAGLLHWFVMPFGDMWLMAMEHIRPFVEPMGVRKER
jgi:polysaccharide biosynthesis transport protein